MILPGLAGFAAASTALGTALAAAAAGYALTALAALKLSLGHGSSRPAGTLPGVTVLKPLCGAEPDLYECLRSFCEQDHPQFQIIFGVADPEDPALGAVRRLQAEFPGLDLQVVADDRQHGTSRKVSNLINMLTVARHDFLVLADSDVSVASDYLARVSAPLGDPTVGIVTCAYRGRPRPGLWSALGALFINEWFIPSVRVAALTGSRDFAFGATIAIRRRVLEELGGLQVIADQLADDYRLGELTRRAGLATVLSEVVVETRVAEPSLQALVRHELRWLRTIRAVRPLGFALSFVTFGVPVAALGVLLADGSQATWSLLALTALARLVVHYSAQGSGAPTSQWLLLPIRDILSIALWGFSFTTRRVHWRDGQYRIARDGSAQRIVRI